MADYFTNFSVLVPLPNEAAEKSIERLGTLAALR